MDMTNNMYRLALFYKSWQQYLLKCYGFSRKFGFFDNFWGFVAWIFILHESSFVSFILYKFH